MNKKGIWSEAVHKFEIVGVLLLKKHLLTCYFKINYTYYTSLSKAVLSLELPVPLSKSF